MKENFEKLGGIVSEGIKYKPHIGNLLRVYIELISLCGMKI